YLAPAVRTPAYERAVDEPHVNRRGVRVRESRTHLGLERISVVAELGEGVRERVLESDSCLDGRVDHGVVLVRDQLDVRERRPTEDVREGIVPAARVRARLGV